MNAIGGAARRSAVKRSVRTDIARHAATRGFTRLHVAIRSALASSRRLLRTSLIIVIRLNKVCSHFLLLSYNILVHVLVITPYSLVDLIVMTDATLIFECLLLYS